MFHCSQNPYVWDKQSEQGRRYELLVTLELGWTRSEVFIDEPKAIDLDAASKLDAETTLLGRTVL